MPIPTTRIVIIVIVVIIVVMIVIMLMLIIVITDARGLAFDHGAILAAGLDRARSKLEYTPLATAFAGPEFTIAEIRAIYETVWGVELHAGNFHRKISSVPGFIIDTGRVTERGGGRGGPRAHLYRAGPARLLHPALLRPETGRAHENRPSR